MAEQENQPPVEQTDDDQMESFEPLGSLVLTVLYILLTAGAFALLYFNDLLARR